VLGDSILEKQKYLYKSEKTMKAENVVDWVRAGDDIKLKGR